jgi:hypothetical protein
MMTLLGAAVLEKMLPLVRSRMRRVLTRAEHRGI